MQTVVNAVVLTLILTLLTVPAYAGKFFKGSPILIIEGAFGDDTLVATTDGDELKAGAGLLIAGGWDTRRSKRSKKFLRFTVGYKYNWLDADDGDATFTTFPLEALYMLQNKKWTYGIGLALHLSTELEVDTSIGSITTDFDDAIGITGQAAYKWRKNHEFGIHLTAIEYDFDIAGLSGSVDANSVGLYYGYRY